MKTFKKRIPHLDLLKILPDEIDGYVLVEFIKENIHDLIEIDSFASVKGDEFYYDTEFEGMVFMLTPLHCKYITKKLSKDFDEIEENYDE